MYVQTGGRFDLFRNGRLSSLAIVAGFALAAMAAGTVIASGKLALIGLVVGTVFGIVLINALAVTVWILLLGVLLLSGPLIFHFAALEKLPWFFAVLGVLALAAAPLHAALVRVPGRRPVPGFVVLAAFFLLYAVASNFWSDGPNADFVSGLKRHFQFWGLMLVLAVAAFQWRNVRRWAGFFLVLGLAQLPFALYQRLVLVPRLPIDAVTGTFELLPQGTGSSAVMGFVLVVVFCAVIAAYRERMISGPLAMILGLLVAAPLFLGETKIVLLWWPLALLVTFRDVVRRRPFVFVVGLIVGIAALAGLTWIYAILQNPNAFSMTFDERVKEFMDYNFGTRGYFGGLGLNRTTVYSYWWQHHGPDQPLYWLFGHGLGGAFGGEEDPLCAFTCAKYGGYSVGLTSSASLLWDLGVFGVVVFFLILVLAWRKASALLSQAEPGFDRVLCVSLLVSATLLPIAAFYNDYLTQMPSQQVVMAFTLGLIAWRARQPKSAQPQ